ncbi:hypothetical protein FACS189485_00240 [Spirochaetia bacterium]|nr:hypothetical protein FACS189485_00240 [Spirochaetia bacterium]
MANDIVYEYGETFFSRCGENLRDGIIFEVIPRSDRKGIYQHGFDSCSDETLDLRTWTGFELELAGNGVFNITLKAVLVTPSDGPENVEYCYWNTLVSSDSGCLLRAPLVQFEGLSGASSLWRFFKALTITLGPEGQSPAIDAEKFSLLNFRVIRRAAVLLYTEVLSLHAQAGNSVQYQAAVVNTGWQTQSITLIQELRGREAMKTLIEPPSFTLKPGESRRCVITVHLPHDIAKGAYEKQIIHAVANGGGHTETVTLFTGCTLEHPYIFGTKSDFDRVREKINSVPWAAELFAEYQRQAGELVIEKTDNKKPYLYLTHIAHTAYRAALVWKINGDEGCAEKAIALLRNVCDPSFGWLKTKRACNQQLVHEGEFFKSIAMTYDLLFYHAEINADDRKNIEATLRGFMALIDFELGRGHVSNWTLAELAGALFSAQVLQDREVMERFLFGAGGFTEHLAAGVFSDGWWYEVSIGYNLLAAGLFTMMAKSCEVWGYELAHIKVPAVYSRKLSRAQPAQTQDGLCSEVWGPNTLNYHNIEMQWDSLAAFADWRGVCFGLSDTCETKLSAFSKIDPRYDLAYAMYGKASYANIARRSTPLQRDLIFGAVELPENTSENESFSQSMFADNAGVAMLRSQKKGRQPGEQIAVTLKYGSHGGAHGHYDRTALNSLMRYGRSMSNPENVWYSYHTLMYKFYVQNSVNHNMVTVDLKQQDPAEARKLLFFSGSHIQVCAVENNTRWCDPPYGGWHILKDVLGVTHTFEEQCWLEGKYVPIPPDPPEYTRRGNFTEPVLQRRAVVVTDDYVVIFDYIAGEQEHDYDLIYTIKGLNTLTGYKQSGTREKAEDNPRSSAQFITDCTLYEYIRPARADFTALFDGKDEGKWLTSDRSDCNEKGSLNIDLHTLYPPKGTALIANVPANFTLHKQLEYAVEGDGRQLAKGRFGAWILGRDDISVDIENVDEITLRVRVTKVMDENEFISQCLKTIFWGDPRILDGAGKIIYLSELNIETENVDRGNGPGIDYYGGQVKIQARLCPHAIPSEPIDYSREALITLKLDGLDARRFEACIGGGYPPGNEDQLRKWHAVRVHGKSARFISMLEPFENRRIIASAEAKDADTIAVTLADGRVQQISIAGIEDEKPDIGVVFTELRNNTKTTETAKA